MLHRIPLRFALPVVLAATLLPAAAFAQSQDTQSVAEAARRARAHKKNTEKPAKVITEETLDRKSTRLNSSHSQISYAVFCLKKKKNYIVPTNWPNCFVLMLD